MIESAFLAACREEIEAPKPGNVHVFGAGHGMTAEHFLMSAAAAAPPLCAIGERIGRRIYNAVAATRDRVGMNTNLGILLLCAPLAAAAERGGTSLQDALVEALATLDRSDTDYVFAAIALASPGGLGTVSRYDVHGAADVDLLTAMADAADRDRIALQYVSGFNDVFVTGSAALRAARAAGLAPPWTTVAVYLAFLAAFPDSHIMRKYGSAAARDVQAEASEMLDLFKREHSACIGALLGFDARLKSLERNPGTSADLTVATLFAERLCSILLKRRNDG